MKKVQEITDQIKEMATVAASINATLVAEQARGNASYSYVPSEIMNNINQLLEMQKEEIRQLKAAQHSN
jgi:hypothetical protein